MRAHCGLGQLPRYPSQWGSAASGIGAEFARQCAKRARNTPLKEVVQDLLEQMHSKALYQGLGGAWDAIVKPWINGWKAEGVWPPLCRPIGGNSSASVGILLLDRDWYTNMGGSWAMML